MHAPFKHKALTNKKIQIKTTSFLDPQERSITRMYLILIKFHEVECSTVIRLDPVPTTRKPNLPTSTTKRIFLFIYYIQNCKIQQHTIAMCIWDQ